MTPVQVATPERIAEALEATRAVFAEADAELVDPPVMQPAQPFVDLSGEDVRGRLFFVEDPGGEALVLRPDFTIAVCRLHLQRGAATPAAYRYDGKVFRYRSPELGLPTEFIQVGMERFAQPDAMAADASIVNIALEATRAAGAKLEQLVLGDAGLFGAFVEGLGLEGPAAARITRAFTAPAGLDAALEPTRTSSPLAEALAGLSLVQAADALEEIYAIAGVEHVGARTPAAIAERLLEKAADARAGQTTPATADLVRRLVAIEDAPQNALDAVGALAREAGCDLDDRLEGWASRLSFFAGAGAPMDKAVMSIRFARQFHYYDGFVFEVRDPALGIANVLAGGGRYDQLMTRLGADAPISAVGCMTRPGRLAASAERAS